MNKTNQCIQNFKNVVITGCSSGIGLNTAYYLTRQGFRVFATARKKIDIERLQTEGIETCYLDLNIKDTVHAATENILERTDGKIWGLVNNAGLALRGAVEDLTSDDLRSQFEVNVFGLHELTRAFLPHMKKVQEGRIINISSIAGFMSFPYLGCYSASKFALEALSDALRNEIHKDGIHVCIIQPGPIKTQFQINTENSLKRFEDRQNIVHKEVYESIQNRIKEGKMFSKGSIFALHPDAVSKRIHHALTARYPKQYYRVTIISHCLYIFNRFAPTVFKDAFRGSQIRWLKEK